MRRDGDGLFFRETDGDILFDLAAGAEVEFGGTDIFAEALLNGGVRIAIFVLALILSVLKCIRLGLEVRAVRQNPDMVASTGILDRVPAKGD